MHKVFLTATALTLLAITPSWGQSGQKPGSEGSTVQSSAQAPAPMTAEGQLSKVDPDNKTISIRTSTGEEKQFLYTDQTQVVGADGGVEGLGKMSGNSVKIQFDSAGGADTAVQIEVLARQQ